MKTRISVFVLFLLCAILLAACGNSDTNPPAETTVPVTTEALPNLEIVKDGVANFTLIRGEQASSDITDTVVLLSKLIDEYTGAYPEMSTDWIGKGQEYDHTSREILIGNTAYSESAEALKGIPYGDYVVKAIGNKLVINAWSSEGISRAVSKLADKMMLEATEGNFTLPGDFLMTGTVMKDINAVPVYEDKGPDSVTKLLGKDIMLIFKEATTEGYTNYCKALADMGYTLHADNAVKNNIFSTYVNEEKVINVGYYDFSKEIRLILEPRTTLPKTAEENKYEAKVTPKFALVGLGSNSEYAGGQSMIWQLSDGSFIIVDGGYQEADHARKLYMFMRENAPDPDNIVIAAWIITHPHGDHFGGLVQFSGVYAKKVTVEMFVGNFPTAAVRKEGGIADGWSGELLMDHIRTNFPGTPFLTARVGQKIPLRDAEIEIFYTFDSFAPQLMTWYNTSSLVFAVNIAGQRFLVLGDASHSGCSLAFYTFGDYLKSDYVQIAHHGAGVGAYTTFGVTSVYSAAAAPVVLWPAADYTFEKYRANEHNAHALNLPSTKEIVVAGNRTFCIELPYTVGTSGQDTILK